MGVAGMWVKSQPKVVLVCLDICMSIKVLQSKYCRSGIFAYLLFRVKNVCVFNFHHVAKWQKLNAHI